MQEIQNAVNNSRRAVDVQEEFLLKLVPIEQIFYAKILRDALRLFLVPLWYIYTSSLLLPKHEVSPFLCVFFANDPSTRWTNKYPGKYPTKFFLNFLSFTARTSEQTVGGYHKAKRNERTLHRTERNLQ